MTPSRLGPIGNQLLADASVASRHGGSHASLPQLLAAQQLAEFVAAVAASKLLPAALHM